MYLDRNNIDRFFDKVKFTDTCWIWLGGKSSQGYGRFKIDSILYSPHRLIYEYFYESILEDKVICHHCDNPSCVNPGHLFVGTYSDNRKDYVKKSKCNSLIDEGYSWCYTCERFLLFDSFAKKSARLSGTSCYCKVCEKENRKILVE